MNYMWVTRRSSKPEIEIYLEHHTFYSRSVGSIHLQFLVHLSSTAIYCKFPSEILNPQEDDSGTSKSVPQVLIFFFSVPHAKNQFNCKIRKSPGSSQSPFFFSAVAAHTALNDTSTTINPIRSDPMADEFCVPPGTSSRKCTQHCTVVTLTLPAINRV